MAFFYDASYGRSGSWEYNSNPIKVFIIPVNFKQLEYISSQKITIFERKKFPIKINDFGGPSLVGNVFVWFIRKKARRSIRGSATFVTK